MLLKLRMIEHSDLLNMSILDEGIYIRKCVIVMDILLLTALIGCAIPNLSKENQIPISAKINVQQTEYEMITGKYVWDGKKANIRSLNNDSVIELAKDFETLTVEKNTDIEIVIEDNPCLTVFEWNENEEANKITIRDNKITIPSKAGVYVYEVKAKWRSFLYI